MNKAGCRRSCLWLSFARLSEKAPSGYFCQVPGTSAELEKGRERASCRHLNSAALQLGKCSPKPALASTGSDRKGKFAPLAALTPRLGAHTLLRLQPDLLQQTLAAMGSNAVCSAATTLWAALLAQLLLECKEAEGELVPFTRNKTWNMGVHLFEVPTTPGTTAVCSAAATPWAQLLLQECEEAEGEQRSINIQM